MRTLYLDCSMGAAGDMLTAALLELLPDQDEFFSQLNSLGIPNIEIKKELSVKCGINGTHITVTVDGQEEKIPDLHEHSHDENGHHHHANAAAETPHHHNGMHEIEHIIENLKLSEKVKKDLLEVYRLIAEAESHAHGVPVADIHFHEVGAMDAVADIAAVCLLIEKIAPEQIISSPIHVGSGHVRCAHGILPVPAPATAHILHNIPIYGGGIKGELCTPTGAALLKHFVTCFGDMPVIKISAVGYGMGKKDFESVNCVRAILGETEDISDDKVCEICCNLDDMTPESIGFAMECFFDSGAIEVYTVPVGMKKSRPGTMLCVMCKTPDKDAMIRIIFKYTSTIGVRVNDIERHTLSRVFSSVDTPLGRVMQKTSDGYGVTKTKYEHEDIARIAKEKNISLSEVVKLIEKC